ncbi:hypothetical protein [Pseudomonas sp. SMN5]|uniref:hypothetical protein n=1 Tax=Pseudomonas sp. SMN5 TaxID=3390198 RepID=UPI003F8470D1
MIIACLGWGSLIWKPQSLPLASEWFVDGPSLPIEFSRISDGGEVATVICPNAPPSRVLWTVLDVGSLDEACRALQEREQIAQERQDGIGILTVGNSPLGIIGEWAAARQIDAVIWTALPPRLEGVEGLVPCIDDVIGYLGALTGEARDHARHYIQQTPAQIDTPYRRAIIKTLGWG